MKQPGRETRHVGANVLSRSAVILAFLILMGSGLGPSPEVLAIEVEETGEIKEPIIRAVVEKAGDGITIQIDDVQQVQRAIPIELPLAVQAGVVRVERTGRARPVDVVSRLQPKSAVVTKSDARWKYWDRRADPGPEWTAADFADDEWQVGAAPLGYGDRHIKTTVSAGTDPEKKNMVVFFRHPFQVDDPEKVRHLAGGVLCDDAAAVYVNGKEVFRHNLPAGPLRLDTAASAPLSGPQEKVYLPFLADAQLLRKGKNTVAVRVHQVAPNSGDLGFDLHLHVLTEPMAKLLARPLNVDPAARRPLPQQARPSSRSFIHLSDGEVDVAGPDGRARKQKMDALQQARAHVPGARFVRTIPGDTLAKVAAQHSLALDKLSQLNRAPVDKLYTTPDVACIGWEHTVSPNESLASLAQTYNTTVAVLALLNDLSPGATLRQGQRISVPGEFSYRYRKNGYGYLRLARYRVPRRGMAYDGGSVVMRRERVDAKQTLEQLAKEKDLTISFLRKLNGLAKDEELGDREWLLFEYSVKINEGFSLLELAQAFGVTVQQLCDVNQLDENAQVRAGTRLQIPIGNRLSQLRRTAATPPSKPTIREIVFRAAEDSAGVPATEDRPKP